MNMKIEVSNIRTWEDLIWLVGRIGAPMPIYSGWFKFTLVPQSEEKDSLYALPVILKLG